MFVWNLQQNWMNKSMHRTNRGQCKWMLYIKYIDMGFPRTNVPFQSTKLNSSDCSEQLNTKGIHLKITPTCNLDTEILTTNKKQRSLWSKRCMLVGNYWNGFRQIECIPDINLSPTIYFAHNVEKNKSKFIIFWANQISIKGNGNWYKTFIFYKLHRQWYCWCRSIYICPSLM